ncbi:MAG: epoxyqueuosine reductase [Candidatus Lokiarchaeota archaeon]|nr:epoxyqueuosine reductase [Candidatus Lokiarchaeota archaeon]
MVIDKAWFTKKINDFLSNDESNKMVGVDNSLIFESNTIVGFSSGDDPIFDEYKNIIGKFHLTPKEAFSKFCDKNNISSTLKDLSIVAFVLPINEKTKKENYEYSKTMPSERWAHTRLYGEQSNVKLQKYLVQELKKEGIIAVAPQTENYLFKVHQKHENGVWASTWSHRHMLFASGLGSFGLSDGFINVRGKAMRCGSIIVDYKLPSDASERPNDPYEYCTECGDCIKRCPAGAISFESRHDKQKCSAHCFSAIPYIRKNYGIDIYGCGLCQVSVSCSSGIPEKKI